LVASCTTMMYVGFGRMGPVGLAYTSYQLRKRMSPE
jgi:hypothetical protein